MTTPEETWRCAECGSTRTYREMDGRQGTIQPLDPDKKIYMGMVPIAMKILEHGVKVGAIKLPPGKTEADYAERFAEYMVYYCEANEADILDSFQADGIDQFEDGV